MTHVTNIETIASQLKDLDVHISDDEIMAKILSTLPRTFEHMETAWDSMQSNEKTLDNLRARLIQEEKKIKRRQSENNGSRKEEREALAANRYPPRQESSNDNKAPSNRPENHVYRSNRYCNICRRSNHWTNEHRPSKRERDQYGEQGRPQAKRNRANIPDTNKKEDFSMVSVYGLASL
jgi:hypothetical protein